MNNLVAKLTPTVEVDTTDAGLTTVEYAVAAAIVALGTTAAFVALGTKVETVISGLTSRI